MQRVFFRLRKYIQAGLVYHFKHGFAPGTLSRNIGEVLESMSAFGKILQ